MSVSVADLGGSGLDCCLLGRISNFEPDFEIAKYLCTQILFQLMSSHHSLVPNHERTINAIIHKETRTQIGPLVAEIHQEQVEVVCKVAPMHVPIYTLAMTE